MKQEEPANISRSCIFCKEHATSKEDIIPRWIDTTFRLPDGWDFGELRLKVGEKQKAPQTRIATKQTAFKCVCEPCNNDWMSALETEVKPLLAPLINGYERRIGVRNV